MKTVTVKIPADAMVFVLEDSEERIQWFLERLDKVVIAKTVDTAIQALAQDHFDFVFLDHDLGLLDYAGATGPEGNGQEVAKYLSGTGFLGKNVFIHSWNSAGATKMKDILVGAYAVPFGQFEIEVIPPRG